MDRPWSGTECQFSSILPEDLGLTTPDLVVLSLRRAMESTDPGRTSSDNEGRLHQMSVSNQLMSSTTSGRRGVCKNEFTPEPATYAALETLTRLAHGASAQRGLAPSDRSFPSKVTVWYAPLAVYTNRPSSFFLCLPPLLIASSCFCFFSETQAQSSHTFLPAYPGPRALNCSR